MIQDMTCSHRLLSYEGCHIGNAFRSIRGYEQPAQQGRHVPMKQNERKGEGVGGLRLQPQVQQHLDQDASTDVVGLLAAARACTVTGATIRQVVVLH